MKANECMAAALKTYEERGKQYGDSYIRHGQVMKALFPNDVVLKTEADWQRFGTLNMIVSKLIRYTMNWHKPHVDSVHDMGVYCFIEEELARSHHIINESIKQKTVEEIKPYHGLMKPKEKK